MVPPKSKTILQYTETRNHGEHRYTIKMVIPVEHTTLLTLCTPLDLGHKAQNHSGLCGVLQILLGRKAKELLGPNFSFAMVNSDENKGSIEFIITEAVRRATEFEGSKVFAESKAALEHAGKQLLAHYTSMLPMLLGLRKKIDEAADFDDTGFVEIISAQIAKEIDYEAKHKALLDQLTALETERREKTLAALSNNPVFTFRAKVQRNMKTSHNTVSQAIAAIEFPES